MCYIVVNIIDSMYLEPLLENIGFTGKEAKIYLALLSYQEALPSVIAKKASIKRPTAYVVLEHLVRKGLATRMTRKGFKHYRAIDPKVILNEQFNKYITIKNAIPELEKLHSLYQAVPQMSIYEGKEGLIRIMEDTLTAKTEILCWADVTLAYQGILKDYYPGYIKKKIENNIFLQGIFVYDKLALSFQKNGKEELRNVYLVPKKKFPFKNEINIYDDKVAIISHFDEVGVIIQNQNIADTQRSIFKMGFEYAKLLNKR